MTTRNLALAALLSIGCVIQCAQAATDADPLVERGRYLAKIAGCNDCHTSGYMEKNGAVPEQDWLTGDSIGWRGPWGTTYPINLRLFMQTLSEDQWLVFARNKPARPPMPWYALRDMEDADLRALYRFVRHLGPAGKSAPGYVPPDQEPTTPFLSFVPQDPATAGTVQAAPPTPPKTEEKKESHWWDFDLKSGKPRSPADRPGQ